MLGGVLPNRALEADTVPGHRDGGLVDPGVGNDGSVIGPLHLRAPATNPT